MASGERSFETALGLAEGGGRLFALRLARSGDTPLRDKVRSITSRRAAALLCRSCKTRAPFHAPSEPFRLTPPTNVSFVSFQGSLERPFRHSRGKSINILCDNFKLLIFTV